jgi:hypothetical protein
MTETTEPGGSDAAPEPAAAPDRPAPAVPVPTGGQSIVACRALAAPVTVNRAARTVEVVWSTGARARNFVPALGLITEELDMRPEAVRMDALRSGRAPVLDTHRRAGTRDVLAACRIPYRPEMGDAGWHDAVHSVQPRPSVLAAAGRQGLVA